MSLLNHCELQAFRKYVHLQSVFPEQGLWLQLMSWLCWHGMGVQVDILWEEIAEDMGWTIVDCLNHKVVLKKDVKSIKETLLSQVRRLRAVGWHLYNNNQR